MNKTLRVLLYIFSIYHVVLGLIGVFMSGFVNLTKEIIAIFFNFNLTMDAQTIWLIKPFAAYMLIMGVLIFFVAKNPSIYKPAIYAVSALVIIRVIQRIIFALQGSDFIVNADPTRNVLVIIFLALYGVSLFWLAKKA